MTMSNVFTNWLCLVKWECIKVKLAVTRPFHKNVKSVTFMSNMKKALLSKDKGLNNRNISELSLLSKYRTKTSNKKLCVCVEMIEQ